MQVSYISGGKYCRRCEYYFFTERLFCECCGMRLRASPESRKNSLTPYATSVLLNRRRVSRYLGEFNRVVKDSAYTTEQIQQMLQNADQRLRCIILILCSTGCRIGAIPNLTLGNLTKIPDYNLYKIVFYQGTNNEYYTFCTREAATTGIENYLNYRKRLGENLSFNQNTNRWEPEDAPLVRLQFDINDMLQLRHPKHMTLEGLRMALYCHLIKCGIRQVEHLTENDTNRRVRKVDCL